MNKVIQFKPAHWKFNSLYKRGKTYKVYKGGRGGMKSWELAKALVYYMKTYPQLFAVVCRETEVSLKHSAQKLVWDTIVRLGLSDEFTSMVGQIRHNSNGSFVIFKGIGADPDSIKSMEGADIVWVEEAQTVSSESLDILIPTIIRKKGAEIWFSYNPRFRTDAVSMMFDEGHPMAEIYTINYTENPFLAQSFYDEAEEMRRKNPKLFEHIYLGSYLDNSTLIMCPQVIFGIPNFYPDDWIVTGVDIARDGGDALSIWTRRGKGILDHQRHFNMDLDRLEACLLDINRKFHPDKINIDSTGHGSWCADGLRRAGINNIYAINFAEEAWEADKYSNKRTNLYALAHHFFSYGGMVPSDKKQLEKELISSRYSFDTKNRPRMIPKDDIKKIIGCSTDDADGFCLSLYTGTSDMFRKPHQNIVNNSKNMSLNILQGAKW